MLLQNSREEYVQRAHTICIRLYIQYSQNMHENIQVMLKEDSYNAHTICTQCVHNVHTMLQILIKYVHNMHTMCTQCPHNASNSHRICIQ